MPPEPEAELLQRPQPGDSPGSSPAAEYKSSGWPARRIVKKLIRRHFQDRSQWFRHGVQAVFALLNLWLGIQFCLWTRYYETAGRVLYVNRPAGVEGWLPIAGMMNTKYLLETHRVPQIHPAAMFLFLAFLLSSLLLKKAFCSWLCPIGTLSELLWKTGQKLLGRNFRLPAWLDMPLRSFKYILLGFFAFVIGTMSAAALADFLHSPYGLVADVKMLNFFRDMGETGIIVLVLLFALSILIRNFWCRYLCPYGALMGLVSLLSPTKIRRDAAACIDCGKCARACSANLPVDRLVQVRSVECAACMECIAVCPAQNALQFSLPPRRAVEAKDRWRNLALTPMAVAIVLACLFFSFVGYAKATGHWKTNLPRSLYMELVPNANNLSHPGM
ncbi:MAG: 4Fe-4S binding protein [Acidobacteriaceae bacterium]